MSESEPKRGAPACPLKPGIEGGPLILISESDNEHWSRFWGSADVGRAWNIFMAKAKQQNLGGWWSK